MCVRLDMLQYRPHWCGVGTTNAYENSFEICIQSIDTKDTHTWLLNYALHWLNQLGKYVKLLCHSKLFVGLFKDYIMEACFRH